MLGVMERDLLFLLEKKSCICNFQKMASSDDALRIAMTTLLDDFHEVHYNVCQFLCGVIIVHILNKVM